MAVYRENGNKTKVGKGAECWKQCGVPRMSFFRALKWEKEHPGQKWDGAAIRGRGKCTLLTADMEDEVKHYVCVSQMASGGVSMNQVCRVAFDVMASDPELYARVRKHHPEYADGKRRAFSTRWFHRFKKRFPDIFTKKKVEAYCSGRALVNRKMVNSVYDVIEVVLQEAKEEIPPENIWNFEI